MNPGPEADRVLLAHMRDCLDPIHEYTNAERSRFDASRLVQDAVIRNLPRLWTAWPRTSALTAETNGSWPLNRRPLLANRVLLPQRKLDVGCRSVCRRSARRVERGKGDHRHLRGAEEPYMFKDVATLLQDFMRDVEASR